MLVIDLCLAAFRQGLCLFGNQCPGIWQWSGYWRQ